MKNRLKNIWNNVRSIKKRWLITIAIILVILFLILRPRPNPADQPQFTTIQRGDIKQQVSGSGVLDGQNDATLHFQSGGELAFINVKSGDQVTKGEMLAGLDTRALSSNYQQAQNTLLAKQADVDKTLDDIHLSQYGNGGFSNIGTNNETQTQRDTRIAAQTARDSAVDALNAASVALQNSTITSPIDGIVTQAPPLPGETVAPTDIVVQVVDFSKKVFAVGVDESDINKVRLSQSAQFTLNAYGDKTFNGLVEDISPLTHTTSDGATVVTVKISADDPSIQAIIGLNGQSNITTSAKYNTLIIPSSALRGDSTVLVQTVPGKFKAVKVPTGLQNDTETEITGGLKEGDKIVTNPGVIKNVTG